MFVAYSEGASTCANTCFDDLECMCDGEDYDNVVDADDDVDDDDDDLHHKQNKLNFQCFFW